MAELLREKTERRDLLAESGRVTPREVLEAYRETGLLPTSGEWFIYSDRGSRACPLTALARANGDQDFDGACNGQAAVFLVRKRMAASPFGRGFYRVGFTQGFDGKNLSGKTDGYERAGWRDGRRASRFVFSGRTDSPPAA